MPGKRSHAPTFMRRLERVLEQTKPDLIVACYGMNDGIYYPFTQARFEKYQDGMRRLRERAAAVGAKVLACHATCIRPDADPVEDAPSGPDRIPAAL